LTYAFLATDLDHGGTLEPEEVQNLLQVIGGGSEIDLEECRKIMKEAKVSALSLSLWFFSSLAVSEARHEHALSNACISDSVLCHS